MCSGNDVDLTKVLVLYWGRSGGGVRYTKEIMEVGLEQYGIKLYSSFSLSGDMGPLAQNCDYPQVTYDNFLAFFFKTIFLPVTIIQLIRFIKSKKICIVFSPMRHLWSPFINLALSACGIKVLQSIHDAVPHPGDPALFWDMFMKMDAWGTEKIIVFSQHVAQSLTSKYAIASDKIFLSSIPSFKYQAGEKRQISPPLRFLFFGRLTPYKGIDILIKAFSQSRIEAQLGIIGPGKIDAALREICESDERISLQEGWLDEEKVGTTLSSYDFLVLPYIEASQSGAIMAARGVGMPVIVSPVGGLVEQLEDGVTGVVMRETSEIALQEVLEKLCADHQYANMLVNNARYSAVNDNQWTVVAQELASLFRTVANKV